MTVASEVFSLRAIRIAASVSASTADRESSNTMMGVLRTSIWAMAALCFCPPESVTPRSPTKVSYPSENLSIASSRQAISEARRISCIRASEVLAWRSASASSSPYFKAAVTPDFFCAAPAFSFAASAFFRAAPESPCSSPTLSGIAIAMFSASVRENR